MTFPCPDGHETCALAIACLLGVASDTDAASLLRAAEIRIVVFSPTACGVSMRLTMEGASEIDHRIEAFDGSRIDLLEVRGASRVGGPQVIGRTQSLVLKPGPNAYDIRYRVSQPPNRRDRCPLWIPAVPTDGRSRTIELRLDLPTAAVAGRSMPAFRWAGTRGSTTLGHLPAFVRVPYAQPGATLGWDISRVTDGVAVAVFALVCALWAWRRRRTG